MGIIVDIVVVTILLLNIITGYKKGLVNVIFNIFAFLIAIIITLIIYKPVSEIIIRNTNIHDSIKTAIINTNNQSNIETKKDVTSIQEYVQKAIDEATEETKSKATEIVAENVAIKSIEIITGIIVFILIRIILVVLKFLTETIANLPIIKQLNEIGGLAYGAIRGIIIIYITLTIMFFVISINGNGKIANIIDSSYITKFLYDNNIIVNYCLLGKNLL